MLAGSMRVEMRDERDCIDENMNDAEIARQNENAM
jgi:hypothetical protein